MKVLDFLYYYVVQMITSARIRKYRMDRIPDQAAYLISLCFITLMFTIGTLFEYFYLNTLEAQFSEFSFVLIGLIIYFWMRHIYIIKGRYELILNKDVTIYEISANKGKMIASLFLVISYFLPFILIYLLHKINPLNIHSNWK